jgi:peptidoglycan/xylan/chitin deacetylase (PgdA/CDA1 family)
MALRTAKLTVLKVARSLGLTGSLLRSPWRRNRLLILCYHGTSLDDEHLWDPSLYLPPSRLRRRLELVRQAGCNVLPLDTALRRLYSGELPPRSVALTFDDGTYDFYREAFPIVESCGFPVTVYFTTYYAGLDRPVYDPMRSYLLWKGRGRRLRWPEVLGIDDEVELSGPGARFVFDRLGRYPAERRLTGVQKDELLCRLAELLDIDYAGILRRRLFHLMSMAEARELAGRGVDFQLHTHRHGVSLDKPLFQREIADNRERLKGLRDGEANHFCYPGGVFRPEFPRWLREWNITSATTCIPGLASRRTEPLLLPRLVDTSTIGEDEFFAWLSGLASFLPRRRYVEAEGQFLEERMGLEHPPSPASQR